MIGCLNARDLGTSAALGRLTAVSHLMSVRRVGVLAVQESKMLDTRQLPAQVGLKYHGSGAGRSKQHRRVGGLGFFVTQQAASYFTTWAGAQWPHTPPRHAPTLRSGDTCMDQARTRTYMLRQCTCQMPPSTQHAQQSTKRRSPT